MNWSILWVIMGQNTEVLAVLVNNCSTMSSIWKINFRTCASLVSIVPSTYDPYTCITSYVLSIYDPLLQIIFKHVVDLYKYSYLQIICETYANSYRASMCSIRMNNYLRNMSMFKCVQLFCTGHKKKYVIWLNLFILHSRKWHKPPCNICHNWYLCCCYESTVWTCALVGVCGPKASCK